MGNDLEVAIIVPTEKINPLVRKCLKESRLKFPDAEILILTDTVSSYDRLKKDIVVIETGNITISAKRNLGAKRTKKNIWLLSIATPTRVKIGWIKQLKN